MKNAHILSLFATFSLIACGSNDTATDHVVSTANVTHSEPANAQSATADATPPAPSVLNTPAPSDAPMPTPTPTVSAPEPSPTPTAEPSSVPSDPYVGTYAAITLPLSYDGCAGACSPSVTVNPLIVTHDNGAYQIDGANATILPSTTVLNAEVGGPTTMFNCSNAVFADDYGIEARPDGTYHELLTHGTAGDCHGGVHYTCQCQYEARVK